MKRPLIVTIIGVLLLLQSLFSTLFAGGVIALSIAMEQEMLPPDLAADFARLALPDTLSLTTVLTIGIFGLVSSVGLLRLRPWGWLMAMIVQGVSLVVNLLDYVRGDPNYFYLLFSVVVVLYLNQRGIQQVFDVTSYPTRERHNDSVDELLDDDIHAPEQSAPARPGADKHEVLR